jgi:hypothetical protein
MDACFVLCEILYEFDLRTQSRQILAFKVLRDSEAVFRIPNFRAEIRIQAPQ